MNATILVVYLWGRTMALKYAVVYDTPQQCAAAAKKINDAFGSTFRANNKDSAECLPRVQPEK